MLDGDERYYIDPGGLQAATNDTMKRRQIHNDIMKCLIACSSDFHTGRPAGTANCKLPTGSRSLDVILCFMSTTPANVLSNTRGHFVRFR